MAGLRRVVRPVLLSEREAIYKQLADQLVAEGIAYPCVSCTEKELTMMKEEQEAKKLPPQVHRQVGHRV